MKKLFSCLLAGLLSLTVLTPFASAALTEEQQKTLIAYTETFVTEGNEAGKLLYGNPKVKNYGLPHNMILNVCNSLSDITGNAIPPKSPAVTFPGEYLILDCSAFYQLMFKAVFGLRTDYTYKGMYTGGHHASNWSSGFYFGQYDKVMAENEDVFKVYNLKGEVVDLFDTIVYLDGKPGVYHRVNELTAYLEQMQPGDPIVGYNYDSGLGHFMFYAGDGYLYHSTSTHRSSDVYAMRKQKIEDTAISFTDLKVLRLADNILEPDFAGYNVPVDFSKLSAQKSVFDTKAPYFERVDITKNASGQFVVDVRVSDEYGDLQPLAFANQPDILYKSSGYGESGVLGAMLTTSSKVPALYYDYNPSSNPSAETYAFIGSEHQNRTFTRTQNAKQMYNEMGWTDATMTQKLHYGCAFTKENGSYVYEADGETRKYTKYYYQPGKDIGTLLASGQTYYLHAKDCAENTAAPIRLLLTDKVSYAFDESGALLTRYVMNYKTHPLSVSDITADGKIDLFDAMKALEHISGTKRLLSDAAVDANGDGVANVLDVITILKNEGKKPELAAAFKPMTVAGYVE
ncbi:MAG: hypothetical protein E7655_03210 [Ruminococcaceae bacterium]|nr:hypothetical protein [Oscillospiraceae bacterium]